jgi:hypothetical protein
LPFCPEASERSFCKVFWGYAVNCSPRSFHVQNLFPVNWSSPSLHYQCHPVWVCTQPLTQRQILENEDRWSCPITEHLLVFLDQCSLSLCLRLLSSDPVVVSGPELMLMVAFQNMAVLLV